RTADGDFVLDNLDPKVRRWNETGYVYVKRQSSRDTGRWRTTVRRRLDSAKPLAASSLRFRRAKSSQSPSVTG
ncbi:MAG: transglutaminase-like cysteine peptidase, partial [Rhizobiales bacterium]|nr:transglutaminase-like cysteine peptidase [Hyphomicrobiales bacterium]